MRFNIIGKNGFRTTPADGPARAFTLLELLVVIAIIALLAGILLPAMSSARSEGTKAKCLANLRSIGQAMDAYGDDDPGDYSTPVHPMAEVRWRYDGEYEYGGKTGLGVYAHPDFLAERRPLNNYVFGTGPVNALSLFECPGDAGISSAPVNFDAYFLQTSYRGRAVHEIAGTSYRLNNHINFTVSFPQYHDYFYGPYMRPRTRIPDPAGTVLLEETVAEVAKWNSPGYRTMGWHGKANYFSVAFADGHASSIYLAGQKDPLAGGPGYWLLRGDGWRMDCWPEKPVCDRYTRCACCNEP